MRGVSRLRMRNQLLVTFFVLILFSIFSTTYLLINRTNQLVREQTQMYYSGTVNQTIVNINNTIATIDQYYQHLLSNRLVMAGLQNKGFGTDPGSYETLVYLKDLMFSLIMSSDSLDLIVYISKQGTTITSTSGVILPSIFKPSEYESLPAVNRIYHNPSGAVWLVDEAIDSDHLYYMRGIRDPASGEVLGILNLGVEISVFRDQISGLSIPGGGVHISNDQGRILFSSNSAMEGTGFPYFQRLEKGGGSQRFEIDGKLYITDQTSNSWQVISEVSTVRLYENVNKIIQWGVMVAFISLCAGTLLSVYIARMYTHDLTLLVQAMEGSTRGRLEPVSIHGSNVEFRSLATAYNTMVGNIDQLTGDLKQEITEKTKAEEALQNLNETLEQKVTERTEQLEDSLEELRFTQKHLIEKEKMASLGTLVSGIAHEVNNPLNYITTGIAAMEKVLIKRERNPLIDELFENIKIGAVRTSEIVSQLRQYARGDEEEYSEFDIHECIHLALKLLQNEYKHAILIETDFGTVPRIMGNSGKINQVMVNIIKNSIDTLKEKSDGEKRIRITTQAEQLQDVAYVRVDISDSGWPIPQEILEKIFNPFFTTKEPGEGTGLGLSISLNIVQNHLGEIRATNTEEGPKFSIYLPVKGQRHG